MTLQQSEIFVLSSLKNENPQTRNHTGWKGLFSYLYLTIWCPGLPCQQARLEEMEGRGRDWREGREVQKREEVRRGRRKERKGDRGGRTLIMCF